MSGNPDQERFVYANDDVRISTYENLFDEEQNTGS